jgi:hypothetical protein
MTELRVRKHLIPTFGAIRIAQLSSAHIKAHELRRKKDATNATVDRELELLLRALKLGTNGSLLRSCAFRKSKSSRNRMFARGFWSTTVI